MDLFPRMDFLSVSGLRAGLCPAPAKGIYPFGIPFAAALGARRSFLLWVYAIPCAIKNAVIRRAGGRDARFFCGFKVPPKPKKTPLYAALRGCRRACRPKTQTLPGRIYAGQGRQVCMLFYQKRTAESEPPFGVGFGRTERGSKWSLNSVQQWSLNSVQRILERNSWVRGF